MQYGTRRYSLEETILVMDLYVQTRGLTKSKRHAKCRTLEALIGRTVASLDAKLKNFQFLDPACRARGIKGLSGISHADQAVWAEFHDQPERLHALAVLVAATFPSNHHALEEDSAGLP